MHNVPATEHRALWLRAEAYTLRTVSLSLGGCWVGLLVGVLVGGHLRVLVCVLVGVSVLRLLVEVFRVWNWRDLLALHHTQQ